MCFAPKDDETQWSSKLPGIRKLFVLPCCVGGDSSMIPKLEKHAFTLSPTIMEVENGGLEDD